ncbi:carboxymuconolactone decarboxylase family protein [Pendulispora albinea]|uniref:Carboxymuconolactone decarboxylase family protein n=1 Tax=Pendulispora albinea TaxID=2741071 RepID=A0ABZ2LSY7_9BACT
MTASFVPHTPETAPREARAHLERAAEQFGFVPAPLARMASSPSVLEAFAKALPIFEASSLSPLEREVVILAISVFNRCHYCVPMHTAILRRMQAPDALIRALREGERIADPKLAALAAFTRRVLAARGDAGEPALRTFFDAGYTERNALDVVLGVSVFTLTTYSIRLTGAPLDPAFEPFRWDPPAT